MQYRFGEAIYSGVAGNVAYTLEVLVCEKLPAKLYRLRMADGQSVKSALVIRPAAEDGSAPEAFLSFREAEGCAVFSGACYGFTDCAGEAERATDFLKLTRGVESGLCDVIATVASGRETVYFLGGAACETAWHPHRRYAARAGRVRGRAGEGACLRGEADSADAAAFEEPAAGSDVQRLRALSGVCMPLFGKKRVLPEQRRLRFPRPIAGLVWRSSTPTRRPCASTCCAAARTSTSRAT